MMPVFTFVCTVCGVRDNPCHHWLEEEANKHNKFVEGALADLSVAHNKSHDRIQQIIDKENIIISECDLILEKVDAIWDFLHRPQSATLKLLVEGKPAMPATIIVGGTANSLFQEWSGPSGTGVVVPNAGTPAFTSDNPAVATVDLATGVATGVSPGTANITGTDPVNSLSASDVLTVNAAPPPPAVSATLTLTAN